MSAFCSYLVHAQNLIFSMDIIKNIPIQISENLTKGPYFFKDLQILTGNQIFNDATKVSLKFRNSCRKLVIYGWYLGHPEITLFHIMVKKKFNSMFHSNNWPISHNGNCFYVWKNSLPHYFKIKLFFVLVTVITRNIIGLSSEPFVMLRNKLVEIWLQSKKKWAMNFTWRTRTFWS